MNIAPAEIDEMLLKHPKIHEAAAVGVPDPIYGEEVICYVVAKPDVSGTRGPLTEAEVRQHCEIFLPPAKIPKQIIIVTDLPKSDRGKILRDRLREDFIRRMQAAIT